MTKRILQKFVVKSTDGREVWLVGAGEGQRQQLPAKPAEKPRYLRVQLGPEAEAHADLKVWLLDWHAPGLTRWWEVPPFLAHLFSFAPNERERVGSTISHIWPQWTKKLGTHWPARLCLRKAVDRSGRQKDWERLLPEATFSTLGLLTCLVQGAVSSRDLPRPPATSRRPPRPRRSPRSPPDLPLISP